MRIVLVTGGARSGKSSYAQQGAAELGGSAVSVIATARATDDEMTQRIAKHRADRPGDWEVIEAPTSASQAVRRARHDVVLLDCLTVLAANAMLDAGARTSEACEAAIVAETRALVESARARDGSLIVVTNEVGWSIHPATRTGRWYQDALGRANAFIASEAAVVVLMVCGVPIPVKGALL